MLMCLKVLSVEQLNYLRVSGTKYRLDHLCDAHRMVNDGIMDTKWAVNQLIDKLFGKAAM